MQHGVLVPPVRGRSVLLGRGAHPTPPPDVREEVIKYGREHGRDASLHWVPVVNAFEVRFTLRTNDPVQQIMQAGGEEQYEKVLLVEPNPNFGTPGETPYKSLNLWQLGPSGIRQFLERGNTWSGRGEFRSHGEAVQKAKANNQAAKEKQAIDRASEVRRQVHKIPFHRVGIDLKGDKLDG
jgi:hypothetical protein